MSFCSVVFLLCSITALAQKSVRTEDAQWPDGTSSTSVNLRGMGYYSTAFFSTATCTGSPSFQEGYATGRCLQLANGGSVRMDCVGSVLGDGINYPGVQVQYFSSSTACTGNVAFSVYPLNACITVSPAYFTSGYMAYLGALSFKASCMLVNSLAPGIPVTPEFQKTAVIESVYQSQGCKADAIFQLPDTFKAFIQTPLLTTAGCTSVSRAAGVPYFVGKVTCQNGVKFAFSSNFDGACSYDATTPLDAVVTGANPVQSSSCYGPYSTNPTIVNRLTVQPKTIPALSTSLPVLSYKKAGCLQTCYKIYPRCERPSGQPTSLPSTQPSSAPTNLKSKTPSYVPTRGPTSPTNQPTARPTNQPSQQPTTRPSTQPTAEPSSQPSGQPSGQPSAQPSRQPSSQPTRQPTCRPTSQPSRQPTQQPTRQPTAQPSRQPSNQPTGQPSRQPSSQPSNQPSQQPTAQPSVQPSVQPSSQPSQQPSTQPSSQPSIQPTVRPSPKPIATTPTSQPSSLPTMQPSIQPTSRPSRPTGQPSQQPSIQPSSRPSTQPSQQPSTQPSSRPTNQPTAQPSRQPSSQPSRQPTKQPTSQPSRQPTTQPTMQPSSQPSNQPTQQPTMFPTGQPSNQPSRQPSTQPSAQPSSFPTSKPSLSGLGASNPPNFLGCNSTAFRHCLACQVAPPGFALTEVYKQYSCIGQTIIVPSASPTAAPFAPSSAPVNAPTTFAPIATNTGNLLDKVVVSGKQAISVTDSNLLTTGSAFETKTCDLTLKSAGFQRSDVGSAKLPSFACGFNQGSITSRRALLATANLEYLITATNANPTVLAAALSGNAAALQSALANAGFPASVYAASVANQSPTPSPVASSSSSASCFAGTELLQLESGDAVPLARVQVGDRVLSVNTQGEAVYSDVVYVPHGSNRERATFTLLATESGRDLKMTLDHILPVGSCSLPSLPLVAAAQATIGDCVQTVAGREKVVAIDTVEAEGVYTIIAMEELIVVNGIVATPFGGVNPTLANIYYNLHRLAYSVRGLKSIAAGPLVQDLTETVWNVLSVLSMQR